MNFTHRWPATLACALSLIPAAFGAPVEIVPTALRGAQQPQAAMTSSGVVHVSFGRDGAIYCATSTNGGRSFLEPVSVGSLTKLAIGMRRGPRIVANDESVVISAISHADGNLVTWQSKDRGATWSAPVRVNAVTNAAREGLHAMAGDGKGTVYLAWLDLSSGETELRGAVSRNGGRTWGENTVIYRSPDDHICECCHPSIMVDSQGRVLAMWRNWLNGARDMYFSTSRDGGKTFSTARKLGTGTWYLEACPMDGGHLAFGPDDRLWTVWRRDRSLFVADERSERLLSVQGTQPTVGVANGNPFYVWQSGPRLMLRRGSAEPVILAESGAFAAVASGASTGTSLIVWEGTMNGARTILAQRVE